MKRGRPEFEMFGSIDLAKCLVMLSQGAGLKNDVNVAPMHSEENHFECKTCKRRFPSFQALGGHRASHKKPRLVDHSVSSEEEDTKSVITTLSLSSKNNNNNKPKMHECSICGLQFSMGQALGGHMRRHRVEMMNQGSGRPVSATIPVAVPVLKRSNSSRRVVSLDLNLTPLENDLKLIFGKMAPKLDKFF